MVEVEAAEQLSELAPADEEERGPVEIEADARTGRPPGRCAYCLRDVHDRDLVGVDLHRPAVESEEVERREDHHRDPG